MFRTPADLRVASGHIGEVAPAHDAGTDGIAVSHSGYELLGVVHDERESHGN